MSQKDNMLSSEAMHFMILAHLFNNNINELKVCEPNDKECQEQKVRLITHCGEDEKGRYIRFSLEKEGH